MFQTLGDRLFLDICHRTHLVRGKQFLVCVPAELISAWHLVNH